MSVKKKVERQDVRELKFAIEHLNQLYNTRLREITRHVGLCGLEYDLPDEKLNRLNVYLVNLDRRLTWIQNVDCTHQWLERENEACEEGSYRYRCLECDKEWHCSPFEYHKYRQQWLRHVKRNNLSWPSENSSEEYWAWLDFWQQERESDYHFLFWETSITFDSDTATLVSATLGVGDEKADTNGSVS